MGWNNYIVVPKLKLLVRVSRYTELDDYLSDALDKLFDDSIERLDLTELRPKDLSVKDVSILINNHRILCDIATIDSTDELFMHWLESKGLDYDVLNENDIILDEYKKKGYTII